MPRKRRRNHPTTTPATTTPEWQWRTIPVLFAFACGAFVMGLFATSPLGVILFYLSLFGVAAGSAHIVTRAFVERRLRRRQAAAPPAPEARQSGQEGSRVSEVTQTRARQSARRRR
jgi:predicted lipid-binding transport protein (Tim44 family)